MHDTSAPRFIFSLLKTSFPLSTSLWLPNLDQQLRHHFFLELQVYIPLPLLHLQCISPTDWECSKLNESFLCLQTYWTQSSIHSQHPIKDKCYLSLWNSCWQLALSGATFSPSSFIDLSISWTPHFYYSLFQAPQTCFPSEDFSVQAIPYTYEFPVKCQVSI